MIADWSRIVRLGVVVALGACAVVRPFHQELAFAQDDDEDEDSADDDEDSEDEDEEEADADQPPVTAGGLYTKDTYPISEIDRPLTITKGMTELRAGIDVDVSAKTAFEKWGLGFDFRHGLEDNVEIQAGLRSDLNKFTNFNFYAALEASIVYDLVDFRLATAIPYTKTGSESDTKLDFQIGFPFRYAPKPQVGIIALDTFMTINTEGKPDLTPSVGIIVQPAPMLAIKLQGTVIIRDFDTEAENFLIPVSANIQFSPKNLIDIGGEFTFPNLKPPEEDTNGDGMLDPAPKFYKQRMLLLYGQARF